jgi:hypothetical protein
MLASRTTAVVKFLPEAVQCLALAIIGRRGMAADMCRLSTAWSNFCRVGFSDPEVLGAASLLFIITAAAVPMALAFTGPEEPEARATGPVEPEARATAANTAWVSGATCISFA